METTMLKFNNGKKDIISQKIPLKPLSILQVRTIWEVSGLIRKVLIILGHYLYPNCNTQKCNNVLHGKVEMNVDNSQKSDLSDYTNPLTGSNHIYTREEVGSMSNEEFAKHEKEIDAQTKALNGTMPTNGDLQKEVITGGGVVYINSYTRADGTEVKGYYRSRPGI